MRIGRAPSRTPNDRTPRAQSAQPDLGRGGTRLGKGAILLFASVGAFTEGPWKPWDIGLHRHRRRSDSGCRGGEHPADRSASHPPVGEAIGTLAI